MVKKTPHVQLISISTFLITPSDFQIWRRDVVWGKKTLPDWGGRGAGERDAEWIHWVLMCQELGVEVYLESELSRSQNQRKYGRMSFLVVPRYPQGLVPGPTRIPISVDAQVPYIKQHSIRI